MSGGGGGGACGESQRRAAARRCSMRVSAAMAGGGWRASMGPAHLAWMWVGSRDEVLISARFRRRALCNDAKNFRNELLVSAKKIGASQAYAWCIFALTRTQSRPPAIEAAGALQSTKKNIQLRYFGIGCSVKPRSDAPTYSSARGGQQAHGARAGEVRIAAATPRS